MSIIPIYKPYLHRYKTSAIDAVNSEWVSNHGKYVQLATNEMKNILNAENLILMANGTCATHCLFLALKYKHPEIKKIYLPNNCYIAVYNCALMEYSMEQLEIMEIDINSWNMNISEEYLIGLEHESCILICHNMGGIINVEKIKKVRPDIILIEDNCEGIFGKYTENGEEIYTGTSKNILCSSLSFYGNKTITSGEGGGFLTSDVDVYNYIKKIYSQGMSNVRYVHDEHAYNYRMTNIESALLYDQLKDINHILELKENLFNNYNELLKNFISEGKIKLQTCDSKRSNWMYAIRIMNNSSNINDIFNFFKERNVEIRPFFYPFESHKHLKNIKYLGSSEISNLLNKEIIMLPSYPELTKEQQEYIVYVISLFLKN